MNYKKQLLKEELKKFNFLFEYDFYSPEELNEDDPEGGDSDLEGEDTGDIEYNGGDEDIDGDTEIPEEGDIEPEIPEDDAVELDITDLIKNSEEEKQQIAQLGDRLTQTQQILQNIESSFSKMDNITNKLDNMEKEFEKRNPTKEEKLEMQSLKSYPYNIKLTDYWGNKEGNYDAMNQNYKEEPEEYVLTQKDIDDDYSDVGIKNTF